MKLENIIELINIKRPPSPVRYKKRRFPTIHCITQLMEANLHQLIFSFQVKAWLLRPIITTIQYYNTSCIKSWGENLKRSFLYDMLLSQYLARAASCLCPCPCTKQRSKEILSHRIFWINLDCYLKICDFGLSRGFGEVDEYLKKMRRLLAYVVTR